MTTLDRFRSQRRDTQDHFERGVYGTWTAVDGAGAMLSVRGTGTLDEELPILNFGYSFRIDTDSNAEVFMLSLGSDVNDKVALPTIPRDKQHQWGENQGGVQHPTDPARRLEYNGTETWLKDGNYKLGNNKEVEVIVAGGAVTINVGATGSINFTGDLNIAAPNINFDSATLTHNGTNVGDTHVHSQGNDSNGDGEVDTDPPH